MAHVIVGSGWSGARSEKVRFEPRLAAGSAAVARSAAVAETATTPSSELRAEAVLVTTGPGASEESAAMTRLSAAESLATVVSAGATESLAMAEVLIDVEGC